MYAGVGGSSGTAAAHERAPASARLFDVDHPSAVVLESRDRSPSFGCPRRSVAHRRTVLRANKCFAPRARSAEILARSSQNAAPTVASPLAEPRPRSALCIPRSRPIRS